MSRAVRYHVISKIAHGGMAEIFLALQLGAEGFQKQVVLKRILPALAADPSFVRMLVDEAHIASTLNHSNLVQVLDLGKSGQQFFLVLEFVDGWSLEQVRRRAQKARMKFPLPLALHVVGSLCRALAYVHTRKRNGRAMGIVHRDVTPQNVLLSREGEVKLADFGIAKAVGKSEKSATGVIKGKFAYMSPEQSLGGELDARSDLFSVGTVLYVLATGRKPFEGTTDLDVLMQVRKARYEKPSALVRDFNPEVERFIARALRADRSRRWQSAEQMADRIDGILAKLGQTTGASALKRWLETLSAKDGAKAPGELAEQSASNDIIELGSRDLELEEVAPVGADPAAEAEQAQVQAQVQAPTTDGEKSDSEVTTRPGVRRSVPPPALFALPGVAPQQPPSPPAKLPPLPVVAEPLAGTISTHADSYAEYGLSVATSAEPAAEGEAVSQVTALPPPTPKRAPAPPVVSGAGTPPASPPVPARMPGATPIPRRTPTPAPSPMRTPTPLPVPTTGGATGSFTPTLTPTPTPTPTLTPTPAPAHVRRSLRFTAADANSEVPSPASGMPRTVVATLAVLLVGGAALYFGGPFLPGWVVEPVKAWLQRMPAPGGSEWIGDPRPPETR